MRKLKPYLLVLSLLLLTQACGSGNGGNNGTTPDQNATNLAFQDLINSTLFVVDDLQDTQDCSVIESTLNSLETTIQCGESGSISFAVSDFACNDGPPLVAEFTFAISSDDCTSQGETSDGTLSIAYSGNSDSSTLTGLVSTNGFTIQGLDFVLNDVEVLFDIDAVAFISCSGSAVVDGDECEISSDCTACTF